jgi:hypothetical protein
MTTNSQRPSEPSYRPKSQLDTTDDAQIYAPILLALLVAVAVYHYATNHPAIIAAAATALITLAVAAIAMQAKLRDRRAARLDPPSPGVIIGTTKGDWRLARPRPFRLPWDCFVNHLLIVGPTGRGKSYSFVKPIARALSSRPNAGIFYIDGKGDPIHHDTPGDPGVPFDHVFCPAYPDESARWNPLAGPDPIASAESFASALYPETTAAGANFYEQRAVFAITRVATAIALTGHGLVAATAAPRDRDLLKRELVAAGIEPRDAERLARDRRDAVARQLLYHPNRRDQRPQALIEAIQRDHAPDRQTPIALVGGSPAHEVTVAALANVLFDREQLTALVAKLAAAKTTKHETYRRVVTQLHHDIAGLAAINKRDHAATLANLQNRLAVFLAPPFLELCNTSDFRITDVAAGSHVAMLLPVGAFPNAAPALGRVAIAQFKHAVLSATASRPKYGIFEEFANFVDDAFPALLNMARSHGGGAVLALQSLHDIPYEIRHKMLANIATVAVTPGSEPENARYWSEAFGSQPRDHISHSYEPHHALGPRRPNLGARRAARDPALEPDRHRRARQGIRAHPCRLRAQDLPRHQGHDRA